MTTTSPGSMLPRLHGREARPPPSRRRAPGRGGRSRSWPASFTTQPSGARLPRRIARPPVGLSGVSIGDDDLLARASPRRPSAISPSVRPSTFGASPWTRPRLRAARGRRAPTPPAAYTSVATKRPHGFMFATIGVRAAIRVEVVDRKGIPNSRAIASRWRTPFVEPPVAAIDGGGVLERLARDDLRRAGCRCARGPSRACRPRSAASSFVGCERRDPVQAGGADAEELEHRRHRVRGELAAARAGAGARDALELVQLGRRSSSRPRARRSPRRRPGSSRRGRGSGPGAIEPL